MKVIEMGDLFIPLICVSLCKGSVAMRKKMFDCVHHTYQKLNYINQKPL